MTCPYITTTSSKTAKHASQPSSTTSFCLIFDLAPLGIVSLPHTIASLDVCPLQLEER